MKHKKYIIAISYGNYMYSLGGTDKVVLEHQRMFEQNGISYLYIFPLNISNSKPKENNRIWGVVEDGKLVTAFHTKNLLNYIYKLNLFGFNCLEIHIHHLRNVCLYDVDRKSTRLNSSH